MAGLGGDVEDDELFLDVDTDSDDGIRKPEVPQSLNANGKELILTLTLVSLNLHLTVTVTVP